MEQYIIPNLKNALDIITLLVESKSGLTAIEIEENLSLPRTTVFRILKTLQFQHFVEKNKNLYQAGTSLLQIGLSALNNIEIRRMAVPVLKGLTRETGFTSHLAIPSGNSSMIIEVYDSPNLLRVASRTGTKIPMYCSSTGKIFLSYLYKNNLENYLKEARPQKMTDRTITELPPLKQEVNNIIAKGYAVDDGEFHEDIRCLASAVRDMENRVIASIGITAPATQFTKSTDTDIKDNVITASNTLSGKMGATI